MSSTSTRLPENVAGLLCYILGWVSGIIFLLIEPTNKFVRFHAFQSIIVFAVLNVVSVVLRVIPVLGIIFAWLVGVLSFIIWVVLVVKALQGTRYKLPWAGDLAEKWAG